MAKFYYPDGNGGRKLIPLDSELPTMSESIKGGAKLGEGLEVDEDEKLNAPFSSAIPNIIKRITQAEINIGNAFMQHHSIDDPLEANLLIFEDFKRYRRVDLFKTKVLNTVGGPNDVYVESLNGILIGHRYILSDGKHSQIFRVKSIACNDGVYDVMFDDPVPRTFNLEKTYLYRTTGKIKDGVLQGASDIKELVVKFDDVWQGIRADTAKSVTLKTTQSNIKNFTLEGNGTFDADGFFTLA